MKNLWIFILFICIVISCDTTYYNKFVIINETPYNIKIEGVNRRSKTTDKIVVNALQPIEIIEIKPKSSFSVLKAKGYHAEPDDIFQNFDIDSVNIIFNDEKILIQFCDNYYLRDCEIERNILGFDTEYVKVKMGKSSGHNEYRYTYTITEEDYNNAVPIEN
jgi:hypothetical protein